MTGEWRHVGALVEVTRFPLKAAGGQRVMEVKIGWHGVAGDRRWALLRTGDLSGLPWVSGREFPRMLGARASIDQSGDLTVALGSRSWHVDTRCASDRARLEGEFSELLGEAVSLQLLWSGTFDAMPISVLSTDSVAALAEGGASPDVRRFRANLLIDTQGARPWPERKWVAREMRIGEVVLRLDRHVTRCQVIDVNPSTGVADMQLFAAVREVNRNRLGVYATPQRVGQVAEGMEVFLR